MRIQNLFTLAKPALSAAFTLALAAATSAQAVEPDSEWNAVLEEARGQTVYFNAWGGSDRINDYLQWAAERVEADYGVTLEHVKVGDIAEVVGQLEAAKSVGRNENGNVDLMWVNGENFASMKRKALTWGPFADHLEHSDKVQDSPSIKNDFSVPVEGLESPWGGAQLVFIYDTEVTQTPPQSAAELMDYVKSGGRFTYPAPPAFHGTTLVKQFLHELTDNQAALAQPVDQATFGDVTKPLWAYLDALHPMLRGDGKSWPTNAESTRQMLDDGEVDIALSFNPNEATAAVRGGQLPDSVRTYVFENGTIGNTHFVTIPWNAKAKAGAMIVANFLLSPDAQARKANPEFWGDPTVLNLDSVNDEQRKAFNDIDLGVWALPIGSRAVLPEPHASWAEALETEWIERYGN